MYKLDIPSQSLIESLNVLSNQTETLVLFPYKLVENRKGQAVQGQFSVREALQQMLQGTGLSGGVSETGVLMVSLADPEVIDKNDIGKDSMIYKKNMLATMIGVALGTSGTGANAQMADAIADSEGNPLGLDEIIVTGSRTPSTTFTTPNPVTVIGNLEALGVDSVGEAISLMPQNTSRLTAGNGGFGNSSDAGAEVANLRGMSTREGNRTLTLIDGRRHVPTFTSGGVDLGLIPVNMVRRVETVTGGGSASYGTDAVAGVVNIIMDDDLDGFKGNIEGGRTTEGDGETTRAGLAFGTAVGNGHLVVGLDYFDDDGIGDCAQARDWCAQNYDIFETGAGGVDGVPSDFIGPDSRVVGTSSTGMFTFGGGRGGPPPSYQQFNAAGDGLVPYDNGSFEARAGITGRVQGGDAELSILDVVPIRPSAERLATMAHYNFEINDGLQGFAELAYSQRETASLSFADAGFDVDIFDDNFYLDPAVATQFPPAGRGGASSLTYNRNFSGDIRRINELSAETLRGVVGFDGEISSDWSWDAYYQYGQNTFDQQAHNIAVNGGNGEYDFLGWSMDVVDDGTGNPICRAELDGVEGAAGCVPLNTFGDITLDADALAYGFRTMSENTDYKQHVLAVNLNGSFEGIGAGAISVATGLEYRKDSAVVTHDEANKPWYKDFTNLIGIDQSGVIEVSEVYAEARVPLLKDMPLAKSLEVTGAIRRTENKATDRVVDESRSQGFTSWKLSTSYEPTDWLRLRATESQDIRAASWYDLFYRTIASDSGFSANAVNPWTGDRGVTYLNGGNFALVPETAKTTTAGFVLTPGGFVDGLQLSVDWFDIEVTDAIAGPETQFLLDECFDDASSPFCDRIEFAPNGQDIELVDARALNLSHVQTSGVDFEAGYRFNLGDNWGSVRLKALATRLYRTAYEGENWAGQTGDQRAAGGAITSGPEWSGTGFVFYENGPFSGNIQVRYVGDGVYSYTNIQPGDPGYDAALERPLASINDNTVPSATYVNLSASYIFRMDSGISTELFVSGKNIFDRAPPMVPGGNAIPTNTVHFDTYGATWKIGARVRF